MTALLRGLRKRCPRCGERDAFQRYFQLRARCPRCGLRFLEEEGGFLGAMTLNYLIAVGLWLLMVTVWLVLTVPDVPVVPLLLASVAVLAVVPIWFYPRSKMVWAAIEYLVARAQPDYRPPARRDPRADELE
ncbi:MAG TPA: DUF983 domain-containing protein [Actinomycetota bacterium]|jgi:uncharacterized protein (DUF983 family)